MLGTTVILSTKKENLRVSSPPLFASVQIERKQIISEKMLELFIDVNPGYFYNTWKTNDFTILLEGIIYNFPENELFQRLQKIAACITIPAEANKLIRSFQDDCDGEYIVTIINNQLPVPTIAVFNDFFGRLPLFYFHNSEHLLLSRDLKQMLQLIPKIKIDPVGLTDYFLFNYQLGTRTLFENIKQFDCKEILYASLNENSIVVNNHKTQLDLNLTTPYKNRGECISSAASQLNEYVDIRNKKLVEQNYKIICDLSGGLDSRTILGVLAKFNTDVEYICHEIRKSGETSYAEAVFKALNNPGKFTPVNVNNVISLEENYLDQLVYNTSAFVNYYSTSICTRTLEEVFLYKKVSSDKIARFGGLGFTDFIRKGYRIDNKPLLSSLQNGYPAALKISEACRISGMNVNDYTDHLAALFNSWPEKSPEEQFKKLYFRYQIVLQSRYAEDRERVHFWNVQPMWNHKIVMEILNRFPLKWRGPYTHTLLLNKIDPRLTSVPINHAHVKFDQMRQLRRMDIKDNSIVYIKLKKFLLRNKKTNLHPQSDKQLAALLNKNYSQLDKLKQHIDIGSAQSFYELLGADYNSTTTLSIYFKMIERLFKSKLAD